MGFQLERVYEVYWIREKQHTDVTKEGYVGITCKGFKKRLRDHKSVANKGDGYTLHKKINEIGLGNLKATVICVCEEDYAKFLERELRPNPFVGWNHAIGGGGGDPEAVSKSMSAMWKDPEQRENRMSALRAVWDSEEYKNTRSADTKKLWSDETYRKTMSKAKSSKEYKEKVSQKAIEQWRDPEIRGRMISALSKAQKARFKDVPWWELPQGNRDLAKISGNAFFDWRDDGMGYRRLHNKYGLKLTNFQGLVRRFKSGWNPWEDEMWLKEFYNV